MPCPDENTIVRYLRGALPQEAARATAAHLDRCPSCTLLVHEIARIASSPHGPTPNAMSWPSPAGPQTIATQSPPHFSQLSHSTIVNSQTPYRAPGPNAGDRIGRYVIDRPLGQGGMGVVLLAHDTTLGRKVALKLLHAGAQNAQAGPRLIREAQAMAMLAHPNVCVVHDAGMHGAEVYVAMEYVEGSTLGAWLAAAPRPYRDVIARFVDAGNGLAAAHRAGILHRDFKPSNVLVGTDGRVRVTDFGLALLTQLPTYAPLVDTPELDPRAALTRTGAVVGTPAYMAPEQLFGGALDARADQFSWCVALYEALYRQRPYRASTLAELHHELGEQPRLPKDHRGVPEAVSTVIARGLRARPDERFPSMTELIEELVRAADAGARFQIRVHLVCQAVATVIHLAVVTRFVFATIDSSSSSSSSPSTSSGDTPSVIELVSGLALVAWICIMVGWACLGVGWAPLNAWGLAKRKKWVPASMRVYGALCMLSCFGLPYGLYALWTFSKASVKAAFGDVDH